MIPRIAIVAFVFVHLFLLITQGTRFAACLPLSHEQFVYANIALVSITSIVGLRLRRESVTRFQWILLTLIGLYGASVFAPTFANQSFSMCTMEACLAPLIIFCFAWVLPMALSRKMFEAIFIGFISLFALHSIFTLVLVATGIHSLMGQDLYCSTGRPFLLWSDRGALVTGIFSNPNGLSSYLLLLPAIALTICAGLRAGARRNLLVGSASLILAHICFLLSRAVTLSTITALAVTGVLERGLPKWLRGLSWLTLIAEIACALYIVLNWRHDNSICLRSFIWGGFLDAVVSNPFGSGWNGVVVSNQNPHNAVLANLVYFGVAGALLFIAIVTLLAYRGARMNAAQRHSSLLLLTLLSMFLIHASVEYVLTYPSLFSNSLFWLALGYLQVRTSPAEPLMSASSCAYPESSESLSGELSEVLSEKRSAPADSPGGCISAFASVK